MDNLLNDPLQKALFLAKQKLKDLEGQQPKVVLHDECGDSLWDDVLAQEDVQTESSSENKEVPKT